MWIERITGDLAAKKRYREYRARVKALPPGYREAAKALERYAMYLGGAEDTETIMRMVDDLADLFERSAADALPLRELVGDDPVAFAEAFLENYRGKSWVGREQARFATSIDAAIAEAGESS